MVGARKGVFGINYMFWDSSFGFVLFREMSEVSNFCPKQPKNGGGVKTGPADSGCDLAKHGVTGSGHRSPPGLFFFQLFEGTFDLFTTFSPSLDTAKGVCVYDHLAMRSKSLICSQIAFPPKKKVPKVNKRDRFKASTEINTLRYISSDEGCLSSQKHLNLYLKRLWVSYFFLVRENGELSTVSEGFLKPRKTAKKFGGDFGGGIYSQGLTCAKFCHTGLYMGNFGDANKERLVAD